jgi:putative glutamine amidotransferase
MRLELDTRRFYLGREYSEAVEAAGGLPIHIPLIPKKGFITAVIENLDGILLPGCDSDVDPAYYGEDPHPGLRTVVPEKDETDMLVLAEAERLNKPVLAVCYGIQVLNVSRGGSLIQDIEAQVENSLKHQQGKPAERNSHAIVIERNSLLFDLAGQGSAKVNSHHHQAVGRVGRDLKEVARANDGVIEGIQDIRPERFVLGVQWHPELSWTVDEFSRRLFERFVGACAERSGSRAGDISNEKEQVLLSPQ